ncbi:peptidoglycan-associated lipoprotein Pal [Agaribacterium sp. ZY112]|uniref:peptidoglycan-associated lipoprotein Pal n=1 Tax=Agaribacterium sp. ZY112 TaxID=3233574 RepID=UPI0035258122
MLKSIKNVVTAASLAALVSACASTQEAEDAAAKAAADADAAKAAEAAAAQAAAAEAAEKEKCANADGVFYFDFDQSLLRAESRAALLVQAECLKKYGSSVRLEGHADERGSREYNMALGERRANAVRDFLVLNGVAASDLETVSYGEERPAQAGSSEASWAANRRVELK